MSQTWAFTIFIPPRPDLKSIASLLFLLFFYHHDFLSKSLAISDGWWEYKGGEKRKSSWLWHQKAAWDGLEEQPKRKEEAVTANRRGIPEWALSEESGAR